MPSEQYTEERTTIAAQATVSGNGAIHILRISGSLAHDLLRQCFSPASRSFTDFEPWKLHHGTMKDKDGRPLDDVLCVFMPGPATYTGEDCAEIYCHGGQAIASLVLETLYAMGARPAKRGEFTQRAFLNGRMDLSQAEAVAELIAAPGREAAEQSLRRLDGELARRVKEVRSALETVRVHMSLAVDFPDDEVEILDRPSFLEHVKKACQSLGLLLTGVKRASLVQHGARVVLAGCANAGKSSLMNALLGRNRALVTDIPGTTRDFIEESVFFAGLPVRLIDTAGLRKADDKVENLGIAMSREQATSADCLIIVLDGEVLKTEGAQAAACPDAAFRELLDQAPDTLPVVVAWNKSDVAWPDVSEPCWCTRKDGSRLPFLAVSARTGAGIDQLCQVVRNEVLGDDKNYIEHVAPNERQASALKHAHAELEGLISDIEAGQLYDLLSVRLDSACTFLDDCIGIGTAQDVLNKVFEGFCIGK